MGRESSDTMQAFITRQEVIGTVLVSLMTSGINGVSDCLVATCKGYDNEPE